MSVGSRGIDLAAEVYWKEAAEKAEARVRELEELVDRQAGTLKGLAEAHNEKRARVAELEAELEVTRKANMHVDGKVAAVKIARAEARVAALEAAMRDILKLTASDEMGILDRVELIACNAIRTQSAPSVGEAPRLATPEEVEAECGPVASAEVQRQRVEAARRKLAEQRPSEHTATCPAKEGASCDCNAGLRPSEAVSVPLGPPLQFSAPPGTFEEVEHTTNDDLQAHAVERDQRDACVTPLPDDVREAMEEVTREMTDEEYYAFAARVGGRLPTRTNEASIDYEERARQVLQALHVTDDNELQVAFFAGFLRSYDAQRPETAGLVTLREAATDAYDAWASGLTEELTTAMAVLRDVLDGAHVPRSSETGSEGGP